MLSDQQTETVRQRVLAENISITTLADDVVDHLCCVIEQKLTLGIPFETALTEAIQELAPEGLEQLQEETILLLNNDKIIFMKKVTYLIGLLSTMCYSLGWAFSVLRWPGGFEMSTYGMMAFLFLFLPMIAVNYFRFKIRKGSPEKWYTLLGFVSAALMGLTAVFKVLHLQGTDFLLLVSISVFVFAFLPVLFFSLYKKAVNTN